MLRERSEAGVLIIEHLADVGAAGSVRYTRLLCFSETSRELVSSREQWRPCDTFASIWPPMGHVQFFFRHAF